MARTVKENRRTIEVCLPVVARHFGFSYAETLSAEVRAKLSPTVAAACYAAICRSLVPR